MNNTHPFSLPHKLRRFGLAILALAVLSTLAAIIVPPTHADTTITVNTHDDELNSDGDCSLREAIQAANTNSAVDNCAAGTGADIITFDNALGTTTITLGSTLPTISSAEGVTVRGGGDITVSGNNQYRIMKVSTGGVLALDKITLTEGNAGEFGYGGALEIAQGNVTITSSAFTDNTAGNSGAIDNVAGTLLIANSTIANNTANKPASGRAGAIWLTGGAASLTIKNSTIVGNDAPNEGGIVNSAGSLFLYNTILANNTNVGDDEDCGNLVATGTVIGTNNLIEHDAPGTIACGTTAPIHADPQLAALSATKKVLTDVVHWRHATYSSAPAD